MRLSNADPPTWLLDLDESIPLRSERSTVTVRIEAVGTVNLPSGRVILCDPSFPDSAPLERTVSPGRYPVSLAIGTFERDGDRRVMAMTVAFGSGQVATFELGTLRLPPGRVARAGADNTIGVDSATACVMSEEAGALLAGPRGEEMERLVIDAAEDRGPTVSYGRAVFTGSDELDAIVFSSGLGDGSYPVFWGLDASGQTRMLIAEFIRPQPAGDQVHKRWWEVWK